jgi:hypothetical protein
MGGSKKNGSNGSISDKPDWGFKGTGNLDDIRTFHRNEPEIKLLK